MSIELSRHLESLGHSCDSFSLDDCGLKLNRLTTPFINAVFQRRLLSFVRKNGRQYDAIQVEHHLLPFPRRAYRYSGALIAKSNGLLHFYDEYQREIEDKLRSNASERGTVAGRLLRRLGAISSGGIRAVCRTFDAADQIHLLNRDELAFVRDELGYGSKCLLVPNGLSESGAAALAASAASEDRASSRTVVFVGSWSIRKGRFAFPEIVRRVRASRPDVSFRLIGTGVDRSLILPEFDACDQNHVQVVEAFGPDELPGLLADAKCGVFPSYVEGFGLGVLEMLAAGIPVVAWDVPGPRELLGGFQQSLLAPKGDVAQLAAQATELLELSPIKHSSLYKQALAASRNYRWSATAKTLVKHLTSGRKEIG